LPALRNAILFFMPKKWHAALEAESRRWHTKCPKCGHESNIWDLGGIRYKGLRNPHIGIWCPACGKLSSHSLTKV
jgi:phage terminase large subunit GpA-like protein